MIKNTTKQYELKKEKIPKDRNFSLFPESIKTTNEKVAYLKGYKDGTDSALKGLVKQYRELSNRLEQEMT